MKTLCTKAIGPKANHTVKAFRTTQMAIPLPSMLQTMKVFNFEAPDNSSAFRNTIQNSPSE